MNSDYEQLLSKDPIGAFEKIKEDYLRYFKTMYRFQDEELDRRKNEELELHIGQKTLTWLICVIQKAMLIGILMIKRPFL